MVVRSFPRKIVFLPAPMRASRNFCSALPPRPPPLRPQIPDPTVLPHHSGILPGFRRLLLALRGRRRTGRRRSRSARWRIASLAFALRPSQSAVTAEAVRQRRTIFANHVQSKTFPAAMEFEARSLMAAPLSSSMKSLEPLRFCTTPTRDFFNDDLAAKATILAGQFGTFSKQLALEKPPAKSIAAPRFSPTLLTPCTARPTWPPSLKLWPTGCACFYVLVSCASCCVAKVLSN